MAKSSKTSKSKKSKRTAKKKNPSVGLFVTCLVDLFRPSVGFAAVKLLEDQGCKVAVPLTQTCCGQPAYNSGDRKDARAIARGVIEAFEGFDYVVAPSGSCAGMLKAHYPKLFEGEPLWAHRAEDFSGKVFELTSFLVDELKVKGIRAALDATATYHDGCSGLREMNVRRQPRKLLGSVDGLRLREAGEADTCCGFGGTFCVKYPDISNRMVETKLKALEETGADLLLAGELGCLMNLAGKLRRNGKPLAVRHVAEVLAGMTDADPIAGTPGGDDVIAAATDKNPRRGEA